MGSLIGFQLCADFAENEPRWNPSRHVLRKLAFRAIQKIQNIAMTGKDRDILVKYLWGGFSVAWGDVVWDLVYSQEDHGGHKRGHVGPSLRISRLYAVEGRLTWKPRLDCEGDYRFPAVVVDVYRRAEVWSIWRLVVFLSNSISRLRISEKAAIVVQRLVSPLANMAQDMGWNPSNVMGSSDAFATSWMIHILENQLTDRMSYTLSMSSSLKLQLTNSLL